MSIKWMKVGEGWAGGRGHVWRGSLTPLCMALRSGCDYCGVKPPFYVLYNIWTQVSISSSAFVQMMLLRDQQDFKMIRYLGYICPPRTAQTLWVCTISFSYLYNPNTCLMQLFPPLSASLTDLPFLPMSCKHHPSPWHTLPSMAGPEAGSAVAYTPC